MVKWHKTAEHDFNQALCGIKNPQALTSLIKSVGCKNCIKKYAEQNSEKLKDPKEMRKFAKVLAKLL